MATKIIASYFTINGSPKTGLVPVITVIDMLPININSNPVIINAAVVTEVINGWYRYDFVGYDPTKSYAITIDGGNTLPNSERFKISANDSFVEDVTIGVFDTVAVAHTQPGTFGELINQIGANTTGATLAIGNMTTLLQVLAKFEDNRTKIDPTNATLTIFDDDQISPIQIFNLLDSNGNPSVLEVCERVPTL